MTRPPYARQGGDEQQQDEHGSDIVDLITQPKSRALPLGTGLFPKTSRLSIQFAETIRLHPRRAN